MKRNIFLIAGLLFVGFLSACGADSAEQLPVVSAAQDELSKPTAVSQTAVWETAVDEQGAVKIEVTPIDLSPDASTLAFEVVMDTHSVDLSMDLAALATLTTDNGRSLTATLWDAVPGGHHVSGLLTFPATEAGTAILAEATQLTLTIADVDAPTRTFNWSITN